MNKNTLEIGEERILETLNLINRFGWLSTAELGKYFWSANPKFKAKRNVSLSQLTKKLDEKSLVAIRKLPGKNGNGLVLLKAGVDLLSKNEIKSQSGKDLGKTINEVWFPSRNWLHDLLTQRLLLAHARRGRKFITERELRKSNVDIDSLISVQIRYPDALLFIEDKIIAIETENSQKTGEKRNSMIENIIRTNKRIAHTFDGLMPDFVMVFSEEKSKIDHRKNVENALKNVIFDDVLFYFATYANDKFKSEPVKVEADEIKRILHKLRHLQIDEENDCELEIEQEKSEFKVELSKFKRMYTWSVYKLTGEDWNQLESDSSAESFIKIKEDIATAILNNR